MIEVGLFVSIGWIFSVCLHEYGHAVVAYWGGDISVKNKGYLTLNPFKYVEPGYSVILPLVLLMMGGIALPGAAVYIDHHNLRSRWWKSAVSAAGPIASILTILLFAGAFRLINIENPWLKPALAFLISLQIWGILINLLPIPSIDGFGIIEPFLPRAIRSRLQPLYRFGTIGLFLLLLLFPPFGRFFWHIATTIAEKLLGIPVATTIYGYILFNRWSLPLLLGLIVVFAVGYKFNRKHNETNLEKSTRFMEEKKYVEAITLLNRELDNDPQNLEAWWQKGTALCKLHYYEESLDCYQTALVIDPGISALWQNCGLLLSAMNQPQQAIDMYNRAIEIDPDDANLWVSKACLWAELNNFRKAIATIDRAVEVDPKSVDAWYQRACYQAQVGNADSAIVNLQQAIQLNPAIRTIARSDPSFLTLRSNLDFHKLTKLD